ncbi:MAG: Hemolysin secretion protein D, chromosomal [Flavobacteriaceae bacterium]|jgi:HlyD family secretion protein|nr:MAG: Hemolysin secretion protein D, chromosomal [Flavobacteriaceae bacterium]|tara:strand:- start:24280 stop:25587 length:1308 start_codon:yes stop_codon:yes gene_type:complete
MPELEEIEIRSNEVQEILGYVPKWMIRWGITVIFGIVLLLIGLSWFVKYPDVIQGNFVLTTEIPPIKLVSKANGKLQKLYFNERDFVSKGDFIAEIESPLSEASISYLQSLSPQIKELLESNNPFPILFDDASHVFGELQSEYNQLKILVSDFQILIHNGYQDKKIKMLKNQIRNYQDLFKISKKQKVLEEKKLTNAQEQFNMNTILYEKEIISKMEFFNQEAVFNQNKQQLENLNKVVVQNSISITDYESQLNEIEYNFNEKKRTLKERIQASLNTIDNFINSWKQNYMLTAPFSGKLSYLSNLNEKQFINAGTELFVVVPENNQYVGYIKISAHGFGKVKTGQRVHIKLDSYPYHEFGRLLGKVSAITPMANSNLKNNQLEYLVKITLINGLQSTFNEALEFSPEMGGTAEIVTEDLRLMQRIFNQFRKILDR